MKLLDILASEMKDWPSTRTGAVGQSESGSLHLNQDARHGSDFFGWTTFKFKMAEDWKTAWVTRSEWQAAVDALNAPKVVEWDGVGDPPVGTVCEYDARPSGKGEPLFVTVEVKYVSDQSIVIICTDVPDGEKKENIGVELALMNGLAMRGKFRAIRTAEQVAAEEREKAIKEMMMHGVDAGDGTIEYSCAALYDAGYRKEPKPCGS